MPGRRPPSPVLLAESVSIDGGTLLLILVVLFVCAAAAVGLMVAGFVWARRAGHGSKAALAALVALAAVEGMVALAGVASVIDGDPNVFGLVAGAVLVGQVVRYLRARGEVAPAADEPGPPDVS